MRSFKYLFLFLIISCNSDESEEAIIDYSKILVQESPWVLDRVEIYEIESKDGHVFTQSEIEELAEIMKDLYYGIFEFYEDGSGLWNSEGWCPNCEITWWIEESGGNEIRWTHRSYVHSHYIRSINQINEMIRNINNENGFTIQKPDGTFVEGNRLIGNYVWN
ncbi:hypothetical protein ACE939_04295 [Aquimarina sp. W85]|uniref:hypothetical protein n=1 Tax=Aquimarina rhodophyticola TaxID=3342246 RepID=UPI00366E885B